MEFKLKIQPFYISTMKMKYIGVNLRKYIQDIYKENYTTLTKEIKIHKWRDIHVLRKRQ